MDTDGRLPMINLSPAAVSDSAGGQLSLDAMCKHWARIKHLFAGGAYDPARLMDRAAFLDFAVKVVRRIDHEPGFEVPPRRWAVERAFGWLARWRRLARDHEQRIDVSEAMIDVAMASLLLRRINH